MKYNTETHPKEIRRLFEMIKDHDNRPHATELYLSDNVLKIYWEEAKDFEQFKYFIKTEIAEYEEHLEWLESINKMFDEWED